MRKERRKKDEIRTGARIVPMGYEVEIDIVPDVGDDAVREITGRMYSRLECGRSMRLSEILRWLKVKEKAEDRYYILMPEDDMDVDTELLHEGNGICGRRICIRGFRMRMVAEDSDPILR